MIANARIQYDGLAGWQMRRAVPGDTLQVECMFTPEQLQGDRAGCAKRLRRARQVLRSQVQRWVAPA